MQSAIFWIPIMMFALGFIVVTVILNRAGWWAHVIGSLLVAVFVYFSTIGLLVLVAGLTHDKANSLFATWAINPLMIAAALVAREVSIWIGLAIAARGRRVRARNAETRAEWDREQDEKRAEYEGTGTARGLSSRDPRPGTGLGAGVARRSEMIVAFSSTAPPPIAGLPVPADPT